MFKPFVAVMRGRLALVLLLLAPLAAAAAVDHADPAGDEHVVLFRRTSDSPDVPSTVATPCHDGGADILRVELAVDDGVLGMRLELAGDAPALACGGLAVPTTLEHAIALILLDAPDGTSLRSQSSASPEGVRHCVSLFTRDANGDPHAVSECAARPLEGWNEHVGAWPLTGTAEDAFSDGTFSWDLADKTWSVRSTGRADHEIDGWRLTILDTLDAPLTFTT